MALLCDFMTDLPFAFPHSCWYTGCVALIILRGLSGGMMRSQPEQSRTIEAQQNLTDQFVKTKQCFTR
jgi:hypothetical protein